MSSNLPTSDVPAHGLDRRQAMQRGGMLLGSLAAAGMSAMTQADDEHGYIDGHVHVWTPDTEAYPLAKGYAKADMQPPSFTPEELFSHCRPLGVKRITLIQMSFYGYDNSYMLDVMERHPGTFSGVAVIDEEASPVETMKSLKAKGVWAFRIQPKGRGETWLDGPGLRSMWAAGGDENLAMSPLINPEYLPSVGKMAAKYPKTPVVVDHFGRVGISGTIHPKDLDNLCRLADHPNVHVKVSAFYALGKKQPPYTDLGPMIRRVVGAFGSERCLWASDCPFQVQGDHTYAASVKLITERLDFLTATDKQNLMHDTAARLYFDAEK